MGFGGGFAFLWSVSVLSLQLLRAGSISKQVRCELRKGDGLLRVQPAPCSACDDSRFRPTFPFFVSLFSASLFSASSSSVIVAAARSKNPLSAKEETKKDHCH